MTADEITDELVRIAGIAAPHERELELRDLKQRSGVGLTSLKQSLSSIFATQRAALEEQRVNPILDQLREQGWFMLLEEGKVWVARFVDSRLNGHGVRKLETLSVPDFTTWVHHLDPDTKIEESPGKIFIKSPEMPRYDGTTIDPNAPLNANGKLNLWRGFGVTPSPDDAPVKAFHDHVMRVCDGDEASATYIMNWIAWGIQNPGKRIGTAIVLIGAPGTGKGMIGNLIASIYGSHGLSLRDKRSVVGDFNAHLTSCAFAFVDEALFSGDKQTADKIKGLITEPTLMTEAKFKARAETTNMLKMIMASNHEHAVQVDPQDRRFAVIRVPDDMPGSKSPYWKDFHQTCNSVHGRSAILEHMLNRDLSNFHPEGDRPVTNTYRAQKRSSLDDDLEFWRRVADQGTINPGGRVLDMTGEYSEPPSDSASALMRKKLVYSYYVEWKDRTYRYSKPVNPELFWRNAYQMGVAGAGKMVRVNGERDRVAEIMAFDDMQDAIDDFLTRGRDTPDG
jgi:hypothetical protein